jgi:hypothetical protein
MRVKRRQRIVLFYDMVIVTELASRLDPEILHKIICVQGDACGEAKERETKRIISSRRQSTGSPRVAAPGITRTGGQKEASRCSKRYAESHAPMTHISWWR